jgi:alkylation response protein AidB-like acyl-CoA dehydrogenase
MHGGIGFTDEHDIGLYLKRAVILSARYGNTGLHRKRYAEFTETHA